MLGFKVGICQNLGFSDKIVQLLGKRIIVLMINDQF